MNIDRIFRYYYRRFQRLRGNPYALAGGFAIGVFIGLTPTMPLHTLTIILVTLATRTSTLAAILSSVIACNPVTYFPIYYFSMVIGNAVTPYSLNWEKIKSALDTLLSSESFTASLHIIVDLGVEASIVLLVGGFILALPFALVSYYLSLYFFIMMKKKKIEKQILH